MWVASLGSFRKTAEKMNTTQPAISSRIAKLEEILGARLFERDTGNILITSEGEALRPYAEEMIKTAERLPEIVQGDISSNGKIQLGLTGYAVATWFPRFQERLSTVFPGVELHLTVDTSTNLKHSLQNRSLDAAFLTGPVNSSKIEDIKFATYEQYWYAAPSSGLNNFTPYNLVNLARFPLITGSKYSKHYLEVTEYLSQNKIEGFSVFPCASYASVAELIESGTGIGILPEHFAGDAEKEGRLIKLICDWTPLPLSFTGSYFLGPKSDLSKRLIEFAKTLV